MVVLSVTMGTWIAIYFRMSSVSCIGSVPRSVPKPWRTDKVRKTVEAIAEAYTNPVSMEVLVGVF